MGEVKSKVLETLRQDGLDPARLLEELKAYPSGDTIKSCIQCGVCTASCPLGSEMTETPRKIVEMVKAGMWDRVMASDTMWFCASCYSCAVRCPRGINLAELMYGLRTLAQETVQNLSASFYQTFSDTVRRYGRMHESDLIIRFALRTNPLSLLKMGPLGLRMLAKGKLSLALPSTIRGAREIGQLYDKVLELEGGV